MGILKERSTKSLISGLTNFENGKNVIKTADMKDLKTFVTVFLNTSDKKQRRKLAEEFKRRHLELYEFLKSNNELVTAETEMSKIVTNAMNGDTSFTEDAEVSNLFKIIEEGLNE